ncbi:DUF4082 domain-containing protein, partial [Algoriphagus antarcticus]
MKNYLKTQALSKLFYLLIFTSCYTLFPKSTFSQTFGTNIVSENALPGNPSSEWELPNRNAGDLSIQGFATDISYNRGETASFKIDSDASSYSVKIYRLGYYQGNGARYIADATVSASLPQSQPTCLFEAATGLTDCGNWAESASWVIPANAISGIYLAKLTRDDTQGASHIAFIVRDDSSTSDLLFQTADATWQAYNGYGGNSLYTGSVSGFPGGHAPKVSYNRPFYTRSGGAGGGAQEDWLFNSEYPMIRFLENNGYDVSYTTNIDTDRRGELILNHKVFLSIGHDEYWSKAMRDNVSNARNSGVHLGFFSGNEVYWKVRWEDSIDPNGDSFRTLVCYKEGPGGENTTGVKSDPSPEWTGLWRFGCSPDYNPGINGACDPENELMGQISWDGTTGTIQVPSDYSNLRFWRNTPVANLANGQSLALTTNSLGYEWDPYFEEFASTYPSGRIVLSQTIQNGRLHQLSLYKHSSGSLVFGAGTVQWAWGLDDQHDRGSEAVSPAMQQATVNLFADMNVQAASLQNGLVSASASTDNQAPSTIISTPVNGSTIPNNSPIAIGGTSTDDNVVAGVEISTDGGQTWQIASGTTNWTYSWTPTTLGPTNIQVRAFDDSGNIGVPTSVSIVIGEPIPPVCPCTVFGLADIPPSGVESDQNPIQLGMKFRSSVDGFVTGVRFFKGVGNSGTHTGQLYNNSGALLAEVIFTNETDSGWQEASFNSPVLISANSTYTISYHSSSGFYSVSNPYFNNAKINNPLTALANGDDGQNGVYVYSTSPAFPNQNFQTSNYWVDVVFATEVGPDNSPPVVVSSSPQNNAFGVNVNANITVTFNEAVNPSTVNSNTFSVSGISGVVSYDETSRTATLNPNTSLTFNTSYSMTIVGGSEGVKDLTGNELANNFSINFTTQDVPPPPLGDFNQGPGGPILVVSSTTNPFSRYPIEILRAEGLNEFAVSDINAVNTSLLNAYDVVILGELPLSVAQVSTFSDWVNDGGTLISFRPDGDLYDLLGITPSNGILEEGYLAIANSGAGVGIVNETMQFHGEANYFTLNGASSLATLYSDANTATTNPAVTLNNVGTNGGKAIAFAFDLAKSIIYTRQGNPAWAGQKRDGQGINIRSDDLFFPDWIDFNKVQIPQADEQQRFLANLILLSNSHKKPLPRFWYLPRKLKAAVVMTGDDHANNGTTGRFDQYLSLSPSNTPEAVADWTAIRATSYIYPNTPISDAQALAFENQGFEVGIHMSTNCAPYSFGQLSDFFTNQLAQFAANFPSLTAPSTHRTHCISWSDWASKPKVEVANGIRLNTDYYYWPAEWIQNRPGMFTGSGMPMRFADLDGSLLDNYQVTTQLTDESGISYDLHINTLLNNALGSNGYYGVFTANMHTDENGGNSTNGSNTIVNAALQRNVPVISAKQMLTWLDGRNNSSFGAMNWNGNSLSFTANIFAGANFIYGMVPFNHNGNNLISLTLNGGSVSFTTEIIKGINYAFFPAENGNYVASYGLDDVAPQITNVIATPSQNGTATITWTTDENASSLVLFGTDPLNLGLSASNSTLTTNHSLELTGLSGDATYFYRITSIDAAGNSVTDPNPPASVYSFITPASPSEPCFQDEVISDFLAGTIDGNLQVVNFEGGEIVLKPTLLEEFSGNSLPLGWQAAAWQGGGNTTFASGRINLNGSHAATTTTFGPNRSIEFKATFSGKTFQNVGFSGDFDFNNPWFTIGVGNTANGIYARLNDNTSILLPNAQFGIPHVFRIDWNANNLIFYVDGILQSTLNSTIAGNLVIQLSDFNVGGIGLEVDWIKLTPYAASGIFNSRIFDAGSITNWLTAEWIAETPTGTSVQVNQRQGNSPVPDGTWTSFATLTNSGNIGGSLRYIQYQVILTTNDLGQTPKFKSIAFGCSESSTQIAPAITLQPLSKIICEGSEVIFNSTASGLPIPTVQWEVSIDGGVTWGNLDGATSGNLVFNSVVENTGNKYRALWTNTLGSVESDIVDLTVTVAPTATISALNSTICEGQEIELQLLNATGTGPFELTVNGISYSGVQVEQIFATISPFEEKSIWSNTVVPNGNPNANDSQPIEIGVKFRSSVSGFIKGIRFYKGLGNEGNHEGKLWSNTGTLLANATFTNETASGWQEVRFSEPIAVSANTTYIASYFSQAGGFAIDANYFANSNSIINLPLTALGAGIDGANGVFKYGGGFPDGGSSANYWVDVIFSETPGNSAAFTLSKITDANGCQNEGESLSSTTVQLGTAPSGSIAAVNPTVVEGQNVDLVFTPSTGISPFTLTINGVNYPNIVAEVPFNVGVPNNTTLTPISIWDNNTIGGEPTVADNDGIEVGVKFRSSLGGVISGIRFFKRSTNTGTHTGTLWSSSGALLASVAFSNESASGWQEVMFDSPVAIEANITYVASYYAPNGQYAFNSNYFTNTGVSTGPLRALQTGENGSGANGVYKYGSTSVFPNESFNDANYWVDVMFVPSVNTFTYTLTNVSDATGCVKTGDPISSATVNIESDVLPPSQPTIAVANATETSITLQLLATDNVGVAEYEVFMNELSIGTTVENSFTVNDLTACTLYAFTAKAKDAAGNISALSEIFNLSTADLTPPVLPILGDVVAECSVTVVVPVAFDTCAGEIVGTTVSDLGFSEQGTFLITWIFDDGNGNVIEAVQNVIIEDITLPVIEVVGGVNQAADENSCEAVISIIVPEVIENCGLATAFGTRSDNLALSAPYPLGLTTITWTAEDASGNQASPVEQTVTVIDSQKPVIAGVSPVSQSADSGSSTAIVSISAPVVTDNCDNLLEATGTRSDGLALSDVYPFGLTTITWTAADASGNQADEVLQTVTVKDGTAPIAVASATPQTGMAPLLVVFSSEGSTDNVAIASYTWNFGDGTSSTEANPSHTYATAGTYSVSLTVTDAEGLSDAETIQLAVFEPTPEYDFSLYLNAGSSQTVIYEGKEFVGDMSFNPVYHSSSRADYQPLASNIELFRSARSSSTIATGGIKYSIPVEVGVYTISTYHIEQYFGIVGAQVVGARVFNVLIEGQVVQGAVDLVSLDGNNPIKLTFAGIQVTDGVLDIEINPTRSRSIISGISIEGEYLNNVKPESVIDYSPRGLSQTGSPVQFDG